MERSDLDLVVSEVMSTDDILMMEKAKQVGEILNKHYPGHLWMVYWQGGALVVKNAALGGQQGVRYGFILPDCTDYGVLRKEAVKAGGELLERAHMRRGKWDGQAAEVLEGADPRHWSPM